MSLNGSLTTQVTKRCLRKITNRHKNLAWTLSIDTSNIMSATKCSSRYMLIILIMVKKALLKRKDFQVLTCWSKFKRKWNYLKKITILKICMYVHFRRFYNSKRIYNGSLKYQIYAKIKKLNQLIPILFLPNCKNN
jgi:hypothetical protein